MRVSKSFSIFIFSTFFDAKAAMDWLQRFKMTMQVTGFQMRQNLGRQIGRLPNNQQSSSVMSKAPKDAPQALRRGAKRDHCLLMLQAMPLHSSAHLQHLLRFFSIRRGACLWHLSELYDDFFLMVEKCKKTKRSPIQLLNSITNRE